MIIDNNSNNLGFYGNAAGGGFADSGYSMASYNGATAWNQLTVVASGGTSTYYIDGQEVGTVPKVSTTGIFAIGNYQGGGQVFSQYLDNVYIYNNTALNAAGVMQLYNATSGSGLPADHGTEHCGGLDAGPQWHQPAGCLAVRLCPRQRWQHHQQQFGLPHPS